MAVTTTQTNKPLNPRGNDQSPKGYNRAELYSGKALDFDGVNDSASVSYTEGIGSVWSWVSIIEFDSVSGYQELFGGQYGSTNATIYLKNTQLDFYTSGDNLNTAFDFETGRKYHIACSQSGDTISVYVNGQAAGSVSLTAQLNRSNGAYIIGKHPVNSNEYLNGKMSGVKLFNTALTAAQVADLYNNPEKVVPTGVDNTALKLWLPMQEGAGTTAYDGSGNGNHGTISGATYTHGIGAPVSQTAVIDWNKGVNLLKYSEKFDDAPNVLDASTYSENEYVSPSGSTDAPKFTETTANDRHGFYQYVTISAGSISASIFTKQIDRRYVHFQSNATGSGENSYIDLEDGSVVSEGTGWSLSTEDYGNGWYRIKATCTAVAGNKYFIWGVSQNGTTNSYAGDTDYDFTFWGAQVKQSASAGLYVPTPVAPQTSEVLLPQGLTSGRDITGVNLFENVRKQGALNLDGNSWAEVHDNGSLDFSSGMTMECWVQIDYIDSFQHILGKWNFPSKREFMIYYNVSTQAVNFNFGHNAAAEYASFPITASGQWFHLVGTTDGTTITPYVNGVAGTTAAVVTALGANTLPVTIGTDYNKSVNQFVDKQLAQPRIYNRALTAEEVARNYDAGKNIYK